MKKLFVLSVLMAFCAVSLYAGEDFFLKYDSNGDCGYADINGVIKIPYGLYAACYTEKFENYAIVLKDDEGFIGIDKNGEKLFNVFPFDNGPDYVSDDSFRIIQGEKIGVADISGKILVPPVYDFTYGFENGLAIVNIGGHKEKVDISNPDCEHYTWRGGKWGVVDKKGNVVLEVEYDYRLNLSSGNMEFTKKDKRYSIQNGKVVNLE